MLGQVGFYLLHARSFPRRIIGRKGPDLYNVGALEARGTGRVDSAKLYWSSTE